MKDETTRDTTCQDCDNASSCSPPTHVEETSAEFTDQQRLASRLCQIGKRSLFSREKAAWERVPWP